MYARAILSRFLKRKRKDSLKKLKKTGRYGSFAPDKNRQRRRTMVVISYRYLDTRYRTDRIIVARENVITKVPKFSLLILSIIFFILLLLIVFFETFFCFPVIFFLPLTLLHFAISSVRRVRSSRFLNGSFTVRNDWRRCVRDRCRTKVRVPVAAVQFGVSVG